MAQGFIIKNHSTLELKSLQKLNVKYTCKQGYCNAACGYVCMHLQFLHPPTVQVARTCAAAVWGLSVSEEARRLLQELGVVEVLVAAARRSLELQCCPDAEGSLATYTGEERPTFSQRQHFQVWCACI